MSAEHGKIEGNRRVADGLDLHGMVTGTVSVASGGWLELRGTVCRDLVLEEGSSVHRYGTVSGDVYNRGSELLVYGSIGGTLHREGGTTVIDSDAAIAGPIP
jgi:cytoskeletal protein CcmA (bactofilin family)